MREEITTEKMMIDIINFEAGCGINDLLQQMASLGNRKNVVFYQIYDDDGRIINWRVEDSVTKEDLHN